jgi:hypothetical protein
VAFFPVQSYNSPTNAIPSSWNNIKDASSGSKFTYSSTNYQNLHLVNVPCADGFIALTSPDFEALTQHSVCTEHGGLGSGYTTLLNPPPVPSTPPPLAINGCSTALPCDPASNAIDVFFVNTYGGTAVSSPQYGFSWINGDGVSVQKVIFTLNQPRYDTLAHEIGHALALTHQNYGASNDPDSSGRINMMLLGADSAGPPATLGRNTSYNSGCQNVSGNFSSGPPPILNNGALYDLDFITSGFNPCSGGNLMADHLTPQPAGAPSACTSPLDSTCTTQEGAAGASPFINRTAPSSANAGAGTCAPFCTSAATTSTTSSSGTNAPLVVTITASGTLLNNPDLDFSIFALLPSGPLSFSGNNPITQIGGTPKSPGLTCDANNLSNCAVTIASEVKLTNQSVTGNPICDGATGLQSSAQCVKLGYSPGFRPGMNIVLAVDFNKDATTIINNNLLAGAQYSGIDANGVSTTTDFGNAVNGFFTADTGHPDFTTPIVLTNQSKFQNVTAANLFKSNGNAGLKLAQCTQPWVTVTVKVKGQLVTETVCRDRNLPDGGE